EGGGHHEQAQILAQGLYFEAEGEAQVSLKAALMKFIEDDQSHAFQGGIELQAAGKNTFGEDLDPRAGADLAVKPRAIANRLANGLFQECCHPLARSPS